MNNRIGEIYTTNEGYRIEIIEYFNSKRSTIKFDDGFIVRNVKYQNIQNGEIKNPFHPSVFGVGYLGVGEYKATLNNKPTKEYSIWFVMLRRCYDEKHHLKRQTYKNVTVCKEWHNFQNFAKWHKNNCIDDCHIDKDILFKHNKIYSPDTCCFVPLEINNLFTKSDAKRGDLPIGVSKYNTKFVVKVRIDNKATHLGYFDSYLEGFNRYKEAKEEHIKYLADKWKSVISNKTYEAMYNYKVEITD